MRSLRAEERTGWELGVLCPGANTEVVMKTHIEVGFLCSRYPCDMLTMPRQEIYATKATSRTYVLVVRIETSLPTGGTHTARLDSWEGDALGAPLWVVDMLALDSPLRVVRTLGWLYAIVRAIETRASRREGDVWWRFLRFLDDVKV